MIHFDGQAISIQVMLQEKLTGHIFPRNVHGFLLQPHQSDIKTLSTLVSLLFISVELIYWVISLSLSLSYGDIFVRR